MFLVTYVNIINRICFIYLHYFKLTFNCQIVPISTFNRVLPTEKLNILNYHLEPIPSFDRRYVIKTKSHPCAMQINITIFIMQSIKQRTLCLIFLPSSRRPKKLLRYFQVVLVAAIFYYLLHHIELNLKHV